MKKILLKKLDDNFASCIVSIMMAILMLAFMLYSACLDHCLLEHDYCDCVCRAVVSDSVQEQGVLQMLFSTGTLFGASLVFFVDNVCDAIKYNFAYMKSKKNKQQDLEK